MTLEKLYRCEWCKGCYLESEQSYTAPTEEHNGLPQCPLCLDSADATELGFVITER